MKDIILEFKASIQDALKKYIKFRGKSSISQFWWFILFGIMGYIFTSIANFIIFGSSFGILGLVWFLFILCPTLAIGARRLHDTGRSGWMQLFLILPIIGLIILIIFWCEPTKDDSIKRPIGIPQ